MATKYIAIPETMYTSLIQMQKDNQIGAEQAKLDLEKIQKSRNKNLSTKNILYNQELRRYLKTKKEEEEKPVKVEVSNGLKGIIKKSLEPTSVPKHRRKKLLSILSQDSDDQDVVETSTEFETPHSTIQEFDNTLTTPKTTDTRYRRLVDLINSNPGKYGVEDDIILNTKLYPTGTDFREALKHHLQPFDHRYSPGSPQGTHLLITRLNKDPTAKRILAEKPIKTTPPSRRRQSGKGIIKTNKKLNKTIMKFKPRLWMKN